MLQYLFNILTIREVEIKEKATQEAEVNKVRNNQ